MNRSDDTQVAESQGVANSRHGQVLTRLRERLPWVGSGAIGGLIASVCCLLPAAAIAIGLAGGLAATLVGLGRFRLYGIIAGLAFVVVVSWVSLRRSRSCCTEAEYRRRQIAIPLTMLLSFGAVYALVMYLVLPMLYKVG